MKKLILLWSTAALICSACNDNTPAPGVPTGDSAGKTTIPAPPQVDSAALTAKNDSLLMKEAITVLQLLKAKNFAALAGHVHPSKGVRFSPYGFIDVKAHKVLTAGNLRSPEQLPEKITWGVYDGTGDPIEAGLPFYFDKFVYDKDFLNAEKKAVNQFLAAGNSLNNLKEIYPGAGFAEFYFSGFDPKYGGMDWAGLRLVFEKEKNK